MKKLKYTLLLFLFSLVFGLGLAQVQAQAQSQVQNPTAGGRFMDGLNKTAKGIGYSQTGERFSNLSIIDTVALAIRFILAIVAIAFMGLLVWGGFTWMKSVGNEQQVTRAKNIVRDALTGLIVVLGAYAITEIVERLIEVA